MKDSTEPRANRTAEPLKPTAILVVDDKKNMVKAIRLSLADEGNFQIESSYSGNEAKRKITSNDNIDIILSDINMPDGSGQDLYNWLKENRPDLVIRTIFMTASDQTNGPQAFIQEMEKKKRLLRKPFSVEEMRDLIKQILSECAAK